MGAPKQRCSASPTPEPCAPCYRFTCPYAMECLDIPPEEVVEAALALGQTVSDGKRGLGDVAEEKLKASASVG